MEIQIPARSPQALVFFVIGANTRFTIFRILENDDRIQCPCTNEYSTFCIQECGPISRHSDIIVGGILVSLWISLYNRRPRLIINRCLFICCCF